MYSQRYREGLPHDFPAQLLAAGQDLAPQGSDEFAWSYPSVLEVIDAFAERNQAILGGEVYRAVQPRIAVTGDAWDVHRDQEQPWAEYVRDSAEKAKRYLETYHTRNGEGVWYTPFYISDVGWVELMKRHHQVS